MTELEYRQILRNVARLMVSRHLTDLLERHTEAELVERFVQYAVTHDDLAMRDVAARVRLMVELEEATQ